MGTVTVHSKRDEHGQLFYANCQLLTGQGAVVFENGEATVTPEQAALLANNPSVALSRNGVGLQAEPIVPNPGPMLPVGLQDASYDELKLASDAIEAHRAGLDAFDVWSTGIVNGWDLPEDAIAPTGTSAPPTPPAAQEEANEDDKGDGGDVEPAPGGEGDPTEPLAADTKVDPSLQAAREHLKSEGEHVPKVLPAGFEANTSEGEPRCYARKGDGSQCSNAAKMDQAGEHSTYACGLGTHQTQVAQLP